MTRARLGKDVILGFQTDDVAAFVQRAVDAGGKIVDPVRDDPEHGVMVGFVSDPEGHLIEVVQVTEQMAVFAH
jgi:lactoylglutathione lyase